MLRGISVVLVAVSLFSISGCATTNPKISPMQIRQITTKQIDGDYENIYRASLTVLQDNGYIIKNTDMNSGLIVANVDRETSQASQFMQAFWVGYVYDKGTTVELSVMVNKLNEAASEIRINIQEINYTQFGGKNTIKQIYDEKLYNNLFNTIVTEVKRREAMKLGKHSLS